MSTPTQTDYLSTLEPVKVQTAIKKLQSTPSGQEYIKTNAQGNVRFALWLRLVDVWIGRRIGLTHRDVADWTWRDAYDEGLSPGTAATEALRTDQLL